MRGFCSSGWATGSLSSSARPPPLLCSNWSIIYLCASSSSSPQSSSIVAEASLSRFQANSEISCNFVFVIEKYLESLYSASSSFACNFSKKSTFGQKLLSMQRSIMPGQLSGTNFSSLSLYYTHSVYGVIISSIFQYSLLKLLVLMLTKCSIFIKMRLKKLR